MKRSILFLGATLVLVLAATTQMAIAQPVEVEVELKYNPHNKKGLQVTVIPWEVPISLSANAGVCEWKVVTPSPVNLEVSAIFVRGVTRPLPNLIASNAPGQDKFRRRGPFKLHPTCAADPNCNGNTGTTVDPPLERYDIVIDLVIDGEPTRVLIDPDHRVKP